MEIVTLYRYGNTIVSPVKPEGTEYTELYRMIADDGKVLTQDGIIFAPCVDTDCADGWREVALPESYREDNTETSNGVIWSKDTLMGMTNAELEQILYSYGITASMTKANMVRMILIAQGGGAS